MADRAETLSIRTSGMTRDVDKMWPCFMIFMDAHLVAFMDTNLPACAHPHS